MFLSLEFMIVCKKLLLQILKILLPPLEDILSLPSKVIFLLLVSFLCQIFISFLPNYPISQFWDLITETKHNFLYQVRLNVRLDTLPQQNSLNHIILFENLFRSLPHRLVKHPFLKIRLSIFFVVLLNGIQELLIIVQNWKLQLHFPIFVLIQSQRH